ncbi:hypothetical protein NLG97_g7325 [Lecanicillium saksenae]|uniref:Uncharacterized protein n=1 Tax=Lecanicillium saksenae TaxID=468837 RepID=A0ACC1QQC5_9HYPO|nr:hypothetical protein NLG97_g7325 [Lecanicillium saksenae]
MKFQHLAALITATAPSLPVIEEKRGYAEPEGAAEWPSFPVIGEEKRGYAEPEGATEWPSLPVIGEE